MPRLPRPALETIAETFRALSEATRLGILQELKEGAKTVNTLVEAMELSQANVSKQLRVLFDAGFLAREQRGGTARPDHHQVLAAAVPDSERRAA